MKVFNHRLRIDRVTNTKDIYEQNVVTRTTLFNIGANIRQLTQYENVASGGDETLSRYLIFEIRRTTETFGITREMIITTLEDNTDWEIDDIDHFSLREKKIIKIFARRRT